MRIAMIGQKGVPFLSGGVERHVEEVAKRLVKMDHEVTVYCRSTYSQQELPLYEGIKLKYIKTYPRKNLEAIIYTFKATVDVLLGQFDIIHFHALGPASLSFIPKLFRKNVVVTLHGLCWKNNKWGKVAKLYLKLGEHVAARFPDKVISVSDNVRDYFTRKYSKKLDDVVYIPNGVNMGLTREPNEIKAYGLERENYILFLSRLVPEKGAHYLIEAFNSLLTDKKLVIAGGSSYTEDYIRKITPKGTHENVVFTGEVAGTLLEELYSNAYLYVLPSDTEGMPLSLLEAMSFKKCCLVSDIPENLAVIQKDFGFRFHKSEVSSLKEMLIYLLDHPEVVKDTGCRAFEEVKSNYQWDSVAEKTESLYFDVIKNSQMKT